MVKVGIFLHYFGLLCVKVGVECNDFLRHKFVCYYAIY